MKKTEVMMFGTRQRLARQKCDETDISVNEQSVKHTDTFKIKRLQIRAARIVYFKAAANLSTDQIMTKLGWKPLYSRRQENILRFVNECIANRVPRYLFNYFNVI